MALGYSAMIIIMERNEGLMDRQVEIYTHLNLPCLILNYDPFLPSAKPSGRRTVIVVVVVAAVAVAGFFPLMSASLEVVSTSTIIFFSQ